MGSGERERVGERGEGFCLWREWFDPEQTFISGASPVISYRVKDEFFSHNFLLLSFFGYSYMSFGILIVKSTELK